MGLQEWLNKMFGSGEEHVWDSWVFIYHTSRDNSSLGSFLCFTHTANNLARTLDQNHRGNEDKRDEEEECVEVDQGQLADD